MDMNEKAETLMSIIERLSGLLVNENENLDTRQFKAIGDTIEEKDKLCRAFELLVRGLSKDGENIRSTDQSLRDELRSCGDQLNALVKDNAASLKKMIQANERLMKAVRDAAVECTPKAGNYTNTGHLSPGARIDARVSSPVTINQIL